MLELVTKLMEQVALSEDDEVTETTAERLLQLTTEMSAKTADRIMKDSESELNAKLDQLVQADRDIQQLELSSEKLVDNLNEISNGVEQLKQMDRQIKQDEEEITVLSELVEMDNKITAFKSVKVETDVGLALTIYDQLVLFMDRCSAIENMKQMSFCSSACSSLKRDCVALNPKRKLAAAVKNLSRQGRLPPKSMMERCFKILGPSAGRDLVVVPLEKALEVRPSPFHSRLSIDLENGEELQLTWKEDENGVTAGQPLKELLDSLYKDMPYLDSIRKLLSGVAAKSIIEPEVCDLADLNGDSRRDFYALRDSIADDGFPELRSIFPCLDCLALSRAGVKLVADCGEAARETLDRVDAGAARTVKPFVTVCDQLCRFVEACSLRIDCRDHQPPHDKIQKMLEASLLEFIEQLQQRHLLKRPDIGPFIYNGYIYIDKCIIEWKQIGDVSQLRRVVDQECVSVIEECLSGYGKSVKLVKKLVVFTNVHQRERSFLPTIVSEMSAINDTVSSWNELCGADIQAFQCKVGEVLERLFDGLTQTLLRTEDLTVEDSTLLAEVFNHLTEQTSTMFAGVKLDRLVVSLPLLQELGILLQCSMQEFAERWTDGPTSILLSVGQARHLARALFADSSRRDSLLEKIR